MQRNEKMQRSLDNRRAGQMRSRGPAPDATSIVQLVPDSVPPGVRGRTRGAPAPLPAGASPRSVVASVWIVILVLTLYGARDVQSFVLHDETLARNSELVGLANGLYSLSARLGLARLRDSLDEAFSPMKQKTAGKWPVGEAQAAAPGGPPDSTPEKCPAASSEVPSTRILVVGASSIEYYLGAELERRLETYRDVVVHRFGKLGTGLARPDNFDWPRQLAALLASFQPEVVIGQFGGNDAQPLRVERGRTALFGTKEWDKEYTRRVRAVTDQVRAAGARLVLLGMPVTRDKGLAGKYAHLNAVTRKATEARGGSYLDTWDIAANPRGQYRSTLSSGGKRGRMYLADGVHYSRLGATHVARRLCWRLERHLELLPGDEGLAPVTRYEVVSHARGAITSYLAFIPASARKGEERLPVLYLLHGADGAWTDFSEHAHELLQRAASELRLVLVTPDGDAHGWYVDSPRMPRAQIETFLMTELLPDVELRLPVNRRKSIAGISMGGNGALALAYKSPEAFVAASSMSGAVDLSEAATRTALVERLGHYEENRALWEENSAWHLAQARRRAARKVPVLLTVGSRDRWARANRRLHGALLDLGAASELKEQPGGHEWAHWLAVLPDHLRWHAEHLHGDVPPIGELNHGAARTTLVGEPDLVKDR